MTFAIILGIWFGCSVIGSPLIGRLLFALSKDEAAGCRVLQGEMARFAGGKRGRFFAAQRHCDDTVQTARRAARGRM